MFNWKGKRVAIGPIPPTPKSTKEKESKFISMCNQGVKVSFSWSQRKQRKELLYWSRKKLSTY